MSVFVFGAAAMADVVFVLAEGSGQRLIDERKQYADQLAKVSRANKAAFAAQYGDDVSPWTAEEILLYVGKLATRDLPAAMTRALSTMSMMHYNCITNNGRTLLESDPEANEALLSLLSHLCRMAGRLMTAA